MALLIALSVSRSCIAIRENRQNQLRPNFISDPPNSHIMLRIDLASRTLSCTVATFFAVSINYKLKTINVIENNSKGKLKIIDVIGVKITYYIHSTVFSIHVYKQNCIYILHVSIFLHKIIYMLYPCHSKPTLPNLS